MQSQMQLDEHKFKKYIYFSLNKYRKLIKLKICCGTQGLNFENKKILGALYCFS